MERFTDDRPKKFITADEYGIAKMGFRKPKLLVPVILNFDVIRDSELKEEIEAVVRVFNANWNSSRCQATSVLPGLSLPRRPARSVGANRSRHC